MLELLDVVAKCGDFFRELSGFGGEVSAQGFRFEAIGQVADVAAEFHPFIGKIGSGSGDWLIFHAERLPHRSLSANEVRLLGELDGLKFMKFYGLMLGLLVVMHSLTGCERSRVLGPPKAVPVREDGALALRLMSFNIRYETNEDLGSRAWRERVAGAVRMIRRERPDVIGVQEALHGQAADLWASLPDYEFIGVGRDDGRRAGEYSGIFYRRERFRMAPGEQGTFWLSARPNEPGSRTWGNETTRVAVWARLVDLASGRGFYVFNTHWDHQSQPSREQAALLIARKIDERSHLDEPVALIGDLNSIEANPGYLYLTGREVSVAGAKQKWRNFLSDAFQVLHSGVKERRTLHFWRGNRDGNLKVDHILVSRDASIEAAEIISCDEPLVSDHYPVTAQVVFPKS